MKNGYTPDKAKAVDLGSATDSSQTKRQPSMVLHELAHAYHDRVLGFGHERIRDAYDAGREGPEVRVGALLETGRRSATTG